MKKIIFIISVTILVSCNYNIQNNSWIRINHLGYTPESIKNAVFVSKEINEIESFEIIDFHTNELVHDSYKIVPKGSYGPYNTTFRLDFSSFKEPGKYYIKVNKIKSEVFRIGSDIYNGTADYLLKYMRQQRCGFNPYLTESCHLDDGFIVYHPTKNHQHIDVTGGWHDATDYLQYTTTSANAIYQMALAYDDNSLAFDDYYSSNGLPGPNKIPDVVDEIKFGVDWLLKMNPNQNEYYNQIADDRDHIGYRLPNDDKVIYDSLLKGRPVYFINGKTQGLGKYKNRSTGKASTVAKFASSYAKSSKVLQKYYPELSKKLQLKAIEAYNYAKKNPGVSQTAPHKAPYFYEEDNWFDDMELAAATIYEITKKNKYKNDAIIYADKEKISPWIGKDTIRHYQYYPFVNLGHYQGAKQFDVENKNKISEYYRRGLEILYQRGKENSFFFGIPFIWCSNNYVASVITQSKLYYELTGDEKYQEMEASLRDWLFGCNIWGKSMIVDLPANNKSSQKPHSSLNILNGYQTVGGLVDGPVYGSIFNSLIGIELYDDDELKDFQSDLVVFHDDAGDYSTNEPTMDGTATLIYYLSSLQSNDMGKKYVTDDSGAIRRINTNNEEISLAFSGHEFGDGGFQILKTLKKHKIKASFFLTGDFLRNKKFKKLIINIIEDGHYIGPHSDKHLLYNDWNFDKKRLVSKKDFFNDINSNIKEIQNFGIDRNSIKYFMPPFQWNDNYITQWASQINLKTINFSTGTKSNADYTTPEMHNYISSEEILKSIINYEKEKNLNGFILFSHIGSDEKRHDKFYLYLDELIIYLKQKGYSFKSIQNHLKINDF